jgi:hypothetical protein
MGCSHDFNTGCAFDLGEDCQFYASTSKTQLLSDVLLVFGARCAFGGSGT